MRVIQGISQQEFERLIQESEEISQSWDTYSQFCRNRDAIINQFFPQEMLN